MATSDLDAAVYRQAVLDAATLEAQTQVDAASAISGAHSTAAIVTSQARIDASGAAAAAEIDAAQATNQARSNAAQTEATARARAAESISKARVQAAMSISQARSNAAKATSQAQASAARSTSSARASAAIAVASAETNGAGTSSLARIAAAGVIAAARTDGASTVASARIAAESTVSGAETAAASTTGLARVQAASVRSTAQSEATRAEAAARTAAAQATSQARISAAKTTTDAQNLADDIALAVRSYSIVTNETSQDFAASQINSGKIQVSVIDATATRYGADRGLDAAKLHEQRETARLDTKLQYAESKFEIVFPFIVSTLFGSVTTTAIPTPGFQTNLPPLAPPRGVVPPDPFIATGQAREASRFAVEAALAATSIASRGFAAASPLGVGLGAIYAQQQIRSTVNLDSAVRLSLAPLNVDLSIKQYAESAELFNAQQQAILNSEGNQVKRQVGLLQGAARMVSGVSTA